MTVLYPFADGLPSTQRQPLLIEGIVLLAIKQLATCAEKDITKPYMFRYTELICTTISGHDRQSSAVFPLRPSSSRQQDAAAGRLC